MSYLLIQADARRIPLKDKSVHCVITSPPYWRLRDYGVPGQLGLEHTPEEYVAHMVEVFREVWRVLKDDGTLWLNIGDSYAGSGKGGNPEGSPWSGFVGNRGRERAAQTGKFAVPDGLKSKNMIGIPWRVAFALQADGWYLRSDCIWSKPNPMPESVQDRPTKSHEYVFLLTKSERYFYDRLAVLEPVGAKTADRYRYGFGGAKNESLVEANKEGVGRRTSVIGNRDLLTDRNLRSVWSIATSPYKGAHFAVMAPKLAERCIKAGTSRKGCCPHCGAPWRRKIKKHRVATRPGTNSKVNRASQHEGSLYENHKGMVVGNRDPLRHTTETRTVGWRPTCTCPEHAPVPCTVFDPFGGAGTTVLVAEALGRRSIATELSPEHLRRARRRIERPHAPIRSNGVRPGDDLPLFAGMEDDV